MFSNICSVLRAIYCVHFFILLPLKGTAAAGAQFDPFNQARGPAPPLENKSEDRYSYLHSSIWWTNKLFPIMYIIHYVMYIILYVAFNKLSFAPQETGMPCTGGVSKTCKLFYNYKCFFVAQRRR